LWNGALKKTGLHKQDKVTKRITSPPKILRKFFRTRANWSNPEIAEFLMGHIGGSMGRINGRNDLVQVYARYEHTPDIVREVYIEAEPNLTILGSTPELYELREETAELRDIAQSKGEEILEKSDLVKYMRRDIEKLKSDNKDLREMVLGLNTLVTELDKQMNEFRDSYQTE
jgi:hypothetical protein